MSIFVNSMAKIGIFDSGAGGLSVFREIRKVLPDEEYIYYSDSANCPYGEKTVEFIIDRCRQITEFLINEGVEIIVVKEFHYIKLVNEINICAYESFWLLRRKPLQV